MVSSVSASLYTGMITDSRTSVLVLRLMISFELLNGMKAVCVFEGPNKPLHSPIECKARVCGKEKHRVFPASEYVFNRHGAHQPNRSPDIGAVDSDPAQISIGETYSPRS